MPPPFPPFRLTAETCGIKHYHDNPRSAILVDFCYYSLMFCEENEFEKEQTSAFFSIMLKVRAGLALTPSQLLAPQ